MPYASTTSSIISTQFLAKLVKEKYNFKENTTCQIIRIGVNHTYLINDNDKKYILRIYLKGLLIISDILFKLFCLILKLLFI